MNVAIVSAVYPPEPVVSGRTSAEIAAALHASGDRVTTICPFPSRPSGRIREGFRRRLMQLTTEGGIEVVRCYATVSPNSTLLSRAAENITFGISAALVLLRLRNLNVVYLNTWPLFATGMAALVARLKGVPYVVSVQDVYPESLLTQKRSGGRWMAPILRQVDAWIARRAAAVIVLSEAFAAIYRETRRVDPARLYVVPNWMAEIEHATAREATEYRHERGIADDELLAVYGGNIGVAAGVEQFIEAIGCIDDPKVRLLVAGEGARADACELLARTIGGNRVLFHRPWRGEETSRVLAAADLLALPTAGGQSQFSVPSKLTSYLRAGRPILAVVTRDSEVARIVGESGAGWTTEPGNVQHLAGAIVSAMRASKAVREEMGTRGRLYAETHFGRDRSVSRVVSIMRGAAR